MSTPTWRFMVTPPATGAWNMAVDAALMRRAAITGESVFRVYRWSHPTLSFGRNQRARGEYSTEQLSAREIQCVRRPTGGRAVLHHSEVTYSVTAPERAVGSLRASYSRINEVIVRGLLLLGARVRIYEVPQLAAAGLVPERSLGPSPCFNSPAPGEIVAEQWGSKVVGSAQWRDAGALLQHGSILLEDDQRIIDELTRVPQLTEQRAATLSQLLGSVPSADDVSDALFSSLARCERVTPHPMDLSEVPTEVLEEAHTLFRDPSWTWRR